MKASVSRAVALAAAMILVLAACGDDEGGGDPTAVDCAPGETDGNLNFYNWSEYMDPDLITAFETEYGVDIVESFYESNEAMLSQIQVWPRPDRAFGTWSRFDERAALPSTRKLPRQPGRGFDQPMTPPGPTRNGTLAASRGNSSWSVITKAAGAGVRSQSPVNCRRVSLSTSRETMRPPMRLDQHTSWSTSRRQRR
jgi:hypothetical protein